MKKQSGFTLIELLLVLAIIGIISAIAIPALLGQRARARDKAAIANCDSVIADGIGQWDKYREMGSTPENAMLHVASYIAAAHSKDMNPWNGADPAYAAMIVAANTAATATVSAFVTAMTDTDMGQVALYGNYTAGSLAGFIGGATLLHGTVNGSTMYRKAAAVE